MVDYRQILNDECGKTHELDIVTADFSLLSSNMFKGQNKIPQLQVSYGKIL